MAFRLNPKATSLNSASPRNLVQSVNPVATGGIHASHVVNGSYSIRDKWAQSRQRVARVPNASPWLQSHGGNPITGWSGIIPFQRTPEGNTMAPVPVVTGMNAFRRARNGG